MMVQAKGPVWHQKQKSRGIIPEGLRGLDKEATWATSKADGWVYGHGTFSLVSHGVPVVGGFKWMRNCAHEGKRLWEEAGRYQGQLRAVVMDSKADDCKMYRAFRRERRMALVTRCRERMNKTAQRRAMIRQMRRPENRRRLKERSHTVEPMQGLVKEIFDLDRCWMRGDDNNRWLFAAMGLAVQMSQLEAYREGRSTWQVKGRVLGEG